MEDLNKNQIVLLTLLVSFVTSIATGIMTVSLLQEAPLEVTRNINRVVEKTIERVTPTDMLAQVKQKEITTIVVNEDDSVTASINKNIKSVVRIQEESPLFRTTNFYGIGLIVSKDGIISTSRKTITFDNIYNAITSDGVKLLLAPVGVDKKTDSIVFKANQPPKNPYVFVPAIFAGGELKLGQTIISIGGETGNAVSVGRVISLQMKDSTVGTTTTKYVGQIDTDVSAKDLVDGSPILNLSGEIVGMKFSSDELKSFTPIDLIRKDINLLTAQPVPQILKAQ